MASQEEIVKKYKSQRLDKLLELQSVICGRFSDQVRTLSRSEDGTSPISTIVTYPELVSGEQTKDLYSKPNTYSNFTYNGEVSFEFFRKLKDRYLKTSTETVGLMTVTANVTSDKDGKIRVSVFENSSYFMVKKDREKSPPSLPYIGEEGFYAEEKNIIITASNYNEAKEKLSSMQYPVGLLTGNKNDRFRKHLREINKKLESDEKDIPIQSYIVFIFPNIELPDGTTDGAVNQSLNYFDVLNPKPEGYGGGEESQTTGAATGSAATGSATTGSAATGSAAPTGSATPTGSTTPTGSAAPGGSSATQTSGSRKYLSIEAIKDDDPPISRERTLPGGTGSKKLISVKPIQDDEDLLINRTYRLLTDPSGSTSIRSQSQAISSTAQANTAASGRVTSPNSNNTNKNVQQNERKAAAAKTNQQNRQERADAAKPVDPKQKSTGTTVSGVTKDGLTEAVAAKKQPIPEDKKPKEVNGIVNSKTPDFYSWVNTADARNTKGGFIYYRGPNNGFQNFLIARPSVMTWGWQEPKKDKKGNIIEPGKSIQVYNLQPGVTYSSLVPSPNVGTVSPTTFGVRFGFGNEQKAFSGYTPESPMDLCLLLNPENVGGFNKNIPYTFGEGSETHWMIINGANIEYKGSGGAGTYVSRENEPFNYQGNWSNEPWWCGYSAMFHLYNNGGFYSSDEESFALVGTSRVNDNPGGWYYKYPLNGGTDIFGVKALSPAQLTQEKIDKNNATIETNDNKIKDLVNGTKKRTGKTTYEKEVQTYKTDIENLEKRIKENKDKLPTLDSNLSDLSKKIEEIDNAIKVLDDKAKTLPRRKLVDQVDIDEKKRLDGLKKSNKSEKDKLEKEKKSTNTSIKNDQDSVNSKKTKLSKSETNLNGRNKEISSLESQNDSLKKENGSLEETRKQQAAKDPGPKIIKSNDGKIKEFVDTNGKVARFKFGVHYTTEGLTDIGKALWEEIKFWPGAYSCTPGHIECVLHIDNKGYCYNIGGNSGIAGGGGLNLSNGSHVGFKKVHMSTMSDEFVNIVRRGDKKPYTNGLGISVKKTKLYQEYVDRVNKKDVKISCVAYNQVLRHIVEL